jgi:hypothetical protein
MTIYLKFPDQETAEAEMLAAGYQLSEYKDHFQPAPADPEAVEPLTESEQSALKLALDNYFSAL